jgi:hypothetical protein
MKNAVKILFAFPKYLSNSLQFPMNCAIRWEYIDIKLVAMKSLYQI